MGRLPTSYECDGPACVTPDTDDPGDWITTGAMLGTVNTPAVQERFNGKIYCSETCLEAYLTV